MTAWNARSSHAESVSRDSEHREIGREKHSIGAAHRAKERGGVRAKGGSDRCDDEERSRVTPGTGMYAAMHQGQADRDPSAARYSPARFSSAPSVTV